MEPRTRSFVLTSLAVGLVGSGLVLAACSADDTTSFTPPETGDDDSGASAQDAGHNDATAPDTGVADAHVADAHVPDAHVPDAHAQDADIPDTNIADTNLADTNVADTSAPDGDVPDTGTPDGDVPDAPPADGDVPDAPADGAPTTDGSVVAVPTDAIGAWGFDEGTGTSSADLSGHAHPAKLMGAATWGTGKSGGGLALDGATGFADLGASLLDTTKSFSVVCWIQLTAASNWQTAISQDGTTLSVFTLKRRDDNAKFDFDFPGSDSTSPSSFTVAQSTTVPVTATWYHVAGVYDVGAGKVKILVNGAVEDSQPPGTILAGAGNTVLGRGKWLAANANFVNGVMDDVRIFGRALSDAEVAAIYTATK